MATYYIDPNYVTGGDGSEATPFGSWSDVTFAAGNTYLQRNGTLYSGEVQCFVTATAASPIIIGTYGPGDRAKIDGADAGKCFTINTTGAYISISGFELYGANTGINKTLGAGTNITVDDCYIHDCTTGASIGGHDCAVRNCVIESIGQDGIFSGGGEGLVIENNVIRNISTATETGDGIQLADSGSYNCSNFIIRNNVIVMSRPFKQGIIVQRSAGTSVGGVIVGNNVTHVSGVAAGATKAIYVEVPGVKVLGNLVVGGNGGIWCESADAFVSGNVVIADSGMEYGILMDESTSYAVSNTLIGAMDVGIATGGTTIRFVHNNVLVGPVIGLFKGASGTTDSYNAYFDVGTANASGTGDVITDPLLDANYRPRAGSPVLAAGTRIADVVLKDFYGKEITGTPDIGAVQRYAARSAIASRSAMPRSAMTRTAAGKRAGYG